MEEQPQTPPPVLGARAAQPPRPPDGAPEFDPRITAVGLVSETYIGLMARLEPQLAENGLSQVDFQVLVRLARSRERRLRMSDLAAQTWLSTSGVTRVVDRLERDGLVRREACAEDRRALYATLTREGSARVAAVLPGHLDLIQTWLVDPLEPEAYEAMLGSLRALRDTVHPGAKSGI